MAAFSNLRPAWPRGSRLERRGVSRDCPSGGGLAGAHLGCGCSSGRRRWLAASSGWWLVAASLLRPLLLYKYSGGERGRSVAWPRLGGHRAQMGLNEGELTDVGRLRGFDARLVVKLPFSWLLTEFNQSVVRLISFIILWSTAQPYAGESSTVSCRPLISIASNTGWAC